VTYLRIASTPVTQIIKVRNGRAYYSTPYFCGWAVDDLKAAVPAHARRWDGASKTWSVEIAYLDAIKAMADAFGPVEVEEATE
jgi:hypothetical protein